MGRTAARVAITTLALAALFCSGAAAAAEGPSRQGHGKASISHQKPVKSQMSRKSVSVRPAKREIMTPLQRREMERQRAAAAAVEKAETVRRQTEIAEGVVEALYEVGRETGVPGEILHAVALNETGRNIGGRWMPWPYSITSGTNSWILESREEAEKKARELISRKIRNVDMSAMQFNLKHNGHRIDGDDHDYVETMLDPVEAARVGAGLIAANREALGKKGDWFEAAVRWYRWVEDDLQHAYRARLERNYAVARAQAQTLLRRAEAKATLALAMKRKPETQVADLPNPNEFLNDRVQY